MRPEMMLSTLALYNYDDSIFDGISLPTLSDIPSNYDTIESPFVPSKAALVDYILMDTADFDCVYADPVILKEAITRWARVRKPSWVEMYRTMNFKYNPIWNKDGTIKETITHGHKEVVKGDGGHDVTNRGSIQHDVTGYDSTTYSPDTRDVDTTGSTVTRDTTDTHTHSGNDVTFREEHGNIGITSTQQLIKESREIAEYNFYEILCAEFKRQFCVRVWG